VPEPVQCVLPYPFQVIGSKLWLPFSQRVRHELVPQRVIHVHKVLRPAGARCWQALLSLPQIALMQHTASAFRKLHITLRPCEPTVQALLSSV
jgi:hypothetical protein